jgi:hemerythrin-like metal-binding protein
MTYFEWKDGYSVGVASLDAQHKELIRLINRLHEADERGGDLGPVLEHLDWYVHHHFTFEEQLMKAADYDRLAEHQLAHQEFEKWLKASRQALAAGMDVQELTRVIADFLKVWLGKHILVVDMHYKALLTAHQSRHEALQVLTAELIRVLEEAHGSLTAQAFDRALSLARDIQLCAKGPAEPPAKE